MLKIGDMLKLHIDGGSDLGLGLSKGWGVPQAGGVESKVGVENRFTL